jgi:prepilin-type N-terminal cleavage/methylation domain-containing protein
MQQGARSERGFTLIELLIVLVIIAILATLTISALESSRQKSRDATRLSDIKQLQLALEVYFSSGNHQYPAALSSLAPSYIPSVPRDPKTGNSYLYGQSASTSYHLGSVLELYNENLASDGDATTTNFGGATTDCVNAGISASANERCFDVVSQ